MQLSPAVLAFAGDRARRAAALARLAMAAQKDDRLDVTGLDEAALMAWQTAFERKQELKFKECEGRGAASDSQPKLNFKLLRHSVYTSMVEFLQKADADTSGTLQITPQQRCHTLLARLPRAKENGLRERLAVVLELRRAAGVAEGDGEELRDTSGRDGLVLRPIAPGQRCQAADNAMRPAGSSAPLQPR